MENPFSITRKGFRTPLGALQVNLELIERIQSQCAEDLFNDEGTHRNEHSVEFQCVFLRYLYPEPIPLKILPVLCGSFDEAIQEGISPVEIAPIRRFIDAFKESVSSLGEEVCMIASADLSHIGLQFGDQEGVREHDLRVLSEEDIEMLGYVERMDGEGFFRSIRKEKNRRRICGLPAIYTLLKVLDAGEGRLLKYGQAFTHETQSVVSFASLSFY
jgi:AmmeMemoRadiSam system protein B